MPQQRSPRVRALRTGALLAGSAVVLATALPNPAVADQDRVDARSSAKSSYAGFVKSVTGKGVRKHLRAFDRIAVEYDDRAAGTDGYDASKDYVVAQLRKFGYHPTVQSFDFDYFSQTAPSTFERTSPDPTTWVEDEDYALMTYSGSGDATAQVEGVDLNLGDLENSTSGCEASDFDDFTAGNIALTRRGTCAFADKVTNAQDAGAVGVIVMNQGTAGRTDAFAGTLGAAVGTVPSIGTSFAIGESLAEGAEVHLAAETVSETRETYNVFADSKQGRQDNVVMAGAHLDSVDGGAGVNDNGSGSAVLLRVAQKLAKKVTPENQVRFAWWGAEELGLVGSEHYIDNLARNNPAALQDIALYLNFDMVGSPNYGLFVYDGDNSRYGEDDGAAIGPEGSKQIERVFRKYFLKRGWGSEPTPFSGRSDYGPFIAQNIPAGGLFTGAEGVKTEDEAEKFGGEAGVAYDVCYHQACDTLGNVNMRAVRQNSKAIAHSIWTYSMNTSMVNGRSTGHKIGPGSKPKPFRHDHDPKRR